MVGRLNLPNVCDGEPLEMSCRADRGLDSPDSGLPPSPSPSAWLPPPDRPGDEGKGSPVPAPPPRLQPLSFGEGIALDPLPATEMRYTSSVRYDSHRHFIQDVTLQPWGRGVERCRQTVTALPHSTWRRYKTELDLEPRHRPLRFTSTTIVYPKKTSAVYTTQLSYDCHRLSRRFLASVELEAAGHRKLPQ